MDSCQEYYDNYLNWVAQAESWEAEAQRLSAAGQDPTAALDNALRARNASIFALAEYQACIARSN